MAGRDIIYGRQPVREALRAGRRSCQTVLIRQSVKPSPEIDDIMALCAKGGIPVERVEHRRLSDVAGGGNHQGVAGTFGGYPYLPVNQLEEVLGAGDDPAFVLFLDHVQDTGNLGALLRTADAVGVDAVIIPSDRSAQVTPAVVRVSAGASEHLQVCVVTNLVRTMKTLQKGNLWIAGLETGEKSQDYVDTDLTGAIGIVVGSEGRGLSRLVRDTCDFLIALPQYGGVSSLNAASAGAVALYEVRRQRRPAKKGKT